MRIVIDARSIHPKMRGVGRHALNLLFGLSYKESDLEFVVLYNNLLAPKLLERSGGPLRGRFQWVKAKSSPGSALEQIEIPWLLKVNRADLFHDLGTVGAWTAHVPSVVTVHELSALHFPVKAEKSAHQIKRTLRASRLIVAVSQSVAEEIETHFNISRPKLRVISNAIDPWYSDRVNEREITAMRDRFKLSGKYFFCVTADKPSKNAEFVQTAAQLWGGNEDWVFTLKGKTQGKLRYLDVVEDVWLRPLYAACTAVIVPSFYEGFSLPPLEALATGVMPVVSDIAPHREILSQFLPNELFFDPKDAQSLARALRFVSDGAGSLSASVLEKFRLVSDRYSFKETAIQIQSVYREALKN